MPIGRNADAGVLHRESASPRRPAAPRWAVDVDAHLAALGELHGVREQVQQNLAQAIVVAEQPVRAPRAGTASRCQSLCAAPRARPGAIESRTMRCSLKRPLVELDAARFDLREVQHVVHDRQQAVAAALERRAATARWSTSSGVSSSSVAAPITALSGVRISWLIVARNARLRARGGLGGVLRFVQRALGGELHADVLERADHLQRLAGLVAHGRPGRDPAPTASRRPCAARDRSLRNAATGR